MSHFLLDVGPEHALRDGRYENYRWQLSWQWARDRWHVTVAPPLPSHSLEQAESRPLLRATHHTNEWTLAIGARASPDRADPPALGSVASALGLEQRLGDPASSKMLGRTATLGRFVGAEPGHPRVHSLCVVTEADATVWLLVSGPPSRETERTDVIETALATLERSARLAALETRVGSYADHRLGFRLVPPNGWLAADRTPPGLASRGRFVRWDRNGSWLGVVAVGGLESDDASAAMTERLESILRGALSPFARASAMELRTELDGVAARHTSWRASWLHVDLVTASHAGGAYALVAVDGDSTAFDRARESFAWLR